MRCFQFVDYLRDEHPVRRVCRVLERVPSRYYAWRAARTSGAVGTATPAWETAAVAVFDQHKRRYGTRRIRAELRDQGHAVGRQALRGALRRHGRRALQPKSFAPRTTDSTHGRRCAPNLLRDQPKPTAPNRVWVSDITYLPLASGQWAYLCAFQDVCTKTVAGWQVAEAMPEALVTSALCRALLAQQPAPGLVVHSDRGGQYCATAYRALLAEHGCQWSQSRRGDCYDNAQAESLWSRLKTEELAARDWPVFADLADAQASVAAYFDYYNHERRHSSIGYLTPYQFHQQQLVNNTQLCPA